MPVHWMHIGIIYSYSNSNNPVTYFHWKIIALAGIWTLDLPGTKSICYQLSNPGLDWCQRICLYVCGHKLCISPYCLVINWLLKSWNCYLFLTPCPSFWKPVLSWSCLMMHLISQSFKDCLKMIWIRGFLWKQK